MPIAPLPPLSSLPQRVYRHVWPETRNKRQTTTVYTFDWLSSRGRQNGHTQTDRGRGVGVFGRYWGERVAPVWHAHAAPIREKPQIGAPGPAEKPD